MVETLYRPFTKQNLYFSKEWIERPGINQKLFSTKNSSNLVICVTMGEKAISPMITDCFMDYHAIGDTKCFPLYYFDSPRIGDLFAEEERRDGITDWAANEAKRIYGCKVKKEQIF